MNWVNCAALREVHVPPGEFALRGGEVIGILDNDHANPVVVTAILERTVVYGPEGEKQLAALHRVKVRRCDVSPIVDRSQSELRREQARTGRAKARIARASNKAARIKSSTAARITSRKGGLRRVA